MTNRDLRRKQVLTIIISILIAIQYIIILRFSYAPGDISTKQSVIVSKYIINFVEETLSVDLDLDESQFKQFVGFVRKAAHFIFYALLGFFIYSLALVWRKSSFKPALYSFLAVVILASMDELIQYFIPGRVALISDVLLDSAGCIFGMLIVRLMYNIYVSRKAKRDVSRINKK